MSKPSNKRREAENEAKAVLRTVRLGYVTGLTTPPLVAAIDPSRLAVLAVLAALLFGGIALGSAALTVRGARGATLRENAR